MASSYNGILKSSEVDKLQFTHNKTDKSQGRNVEQTKTETKQLLHESVFPGSETRLKKTVIYKDE